MFGKPDRPTKEKGGKPILHEDGQKKRWVQHLEELLSKVAPQDLSDIPPASDDQPIDCDRLTVEQKCHSIKQLKNRKSTGPDSIPAEA